MNDKIKSLQVRLADVIAMSGERNALVEQRAGDWILYWFQHRLGATRLKQAMPDVVGAIEAVAETLEPIPAPPFADAQQELSFYLGASVAVVRRLEQVCQDEGDWRDWHDLADQLLVSAVNAVSKIQARGLD